MKITHHVPTSAFRSDPITLEYQREVDRATDKAVVAYERGRRRLEAAELRLRKAEDAALRSGDRRKQKERARELAVAAELVELRREELQRLEALMQASPASAEHRGKRSFRPVPQPGRKF